MPGWISIVELCRPDIVRKLAWVSSRYSSSGKCSSLSDEESHSSWLLWYRPLPSHPSLRPSTQSSGKQHGECGPRGSVVSNISMTPTFPCWLWRKEETWMWRTLRRSLYMIWGPHSFNTHLKPCTGKLFWYPQNILERTTCTLTSRPLFQMVAIAMLPCSYLPRAHLSHWENLCQYQPHNYLIPPSLSPFLRRFLLSSHITISPLHGQLFHLS